jgi:class 3 adenylate cyclase/glycopeptide antibiotics resistance protein
VRRLRPLDVALLAFFLPLWLVCFVLHARELALGRLAWIPLTVSAPADDGGYPAVSGFWADSAAEISGLEIGDRLVAVGGVDLWGAGPFAFAARTWAVARPGEAIPVVLHREGRARQASFALRPVGEAWHLPLLSLGFAIPAVLVLLRRPGSRLVRVFAAASFCYALHWTFFFGGPPVQTALWLAVWFGSALFMFPLALQAIRAFPDGSAPRSRRADAWTWIFGLQALAVLSWVFGVPFSTATGLRATTAGNVLVAAAMLALVTHNYRRSDAVGRRQLKWVLYGFYVAALPVLLANLLPMATPRLWWLHEVAMSAVVLLPVCMLIAITRFKLFDIDRLLTATAWYSIVIGLLVAGVLLAVPPAARALSGATGVDRSTSQVLLAALLALAIVPGGRSVRERLERRLFAERYALRDGVEQLLGELAETTDPEKIVRLAGEQLDALLRPDACVIYVDAESAFVPVFQRGPLAPPVIEPEGGLIEALRARRGPLDVEAWRFEHREGGLDAASWAALDSLRAAVVLPAFAGTELVAFVCLGEKLSGDVYTPSDLSLLAAVGYATSAALERSREAEIQRHARRMQRALRRYVPGAIANELAAGGRLSEGRCEVSVLFVDLRGYTAFSEGKSPDAIFSTINRYTAAVSSIVREHGGAVVEFNGDGMMVVFGAPRALAGKERAAVEAARALSAEVRTLAAEGEPLEVGVGIASGEAFVGNVRAVDRWIWTALGNPTNLAARLEKLTRELGAWIAVDEATWRGAGEVAADFVRRPAVRVRGRREPMDLYCLLPPQPPRAAARS